MPNQCVEPNTSTASAAVADKSRVGACNSGINPTRLATSTNSHKVATNGSTRLTESAGNTSPMAPSIATTIASTAVCQRDALLSRKCSSHDSKPKPSMMPQLVTTVSLMAIGPNEKTAEVADTAMLIMAR